MKITIGQLKKLVRESVSTMRETDEDDNEECSNCDGTGKSFDETCGTCGGKGYLNAEDREEIDNRWKNRKSRR